ncbi:MAG: GAF domain-containing protein [Anaerolineae bacterium]|nr:GAF domain-containing protein [Anaerolineae bacterium]
MGSESLHQNLGPRHIILRLAALIPALVLLFVGSHQWAITGSSLGAWAVCLVMFVTGSILAGPIERNLRVGYLNLAVLVVWLALGVKPALLLLIFGSLITGISLLISHLPVPLLSAVSYVSSRALGHIVVLGLPLLFASAIYTPPPPLVEIQSDTAFSLVIALLFDYTLVIVLGTIFSTRLRNLLVLQQHWLLELMELALVLPLVLIYSQAGMWVFAVVVLLVTIQAYRFYQVEQYRDQLSRRVRELSLLNNIGQSTSANLVLDEVLLSIYQQVNRVVDASVFYIAIYEERQKMLDFRLVMAGKRSVHWAPRRLNEGPLDYVIRHKKPLRISADDRMLVREMGDLTQSARYLTFLGLPLMVGSEVLGVMAVLSDQTTTAFDQDEIRLLQTIASQAGLAVRNAILFTQRAELANKLSYINQSVQDVLFNPDRQNALKAACETAQMITEANKVAIFLLNEDRRFFRLEHSVGLTPAHEQYCRELIYQPEHYQGGPLIVSNLKDDQVYADLGLRYEFHSFAEIPLRSSSVVQGMMSIFYDKPHYFSPSELDLLGMLATQVSAMLDNAEVFRVLEQQAKEMAELVDLARISSSTMKLDTLLNNLSANLRQIFDAKYVSIMLVSQDETSTQFLLNERKEMTKVNPGRLPELKALLDSPEPAPVTLHRINPGLSSRAAIVMEQSQVETMVFVPILLENELIGVVAMGFREFTAFSYLDMQFVTMATNQIAVQIRNVQEYENTQKALERGLEQISLIEDIARQVSSSLDFNQIIQHVLEAAMNAVRADLVSLALLTEGGDFYVIEERSVGRELEKRVYGLPRESGITGHVATTGKFELVQDNNASPIYFSHFPEKYQSSLAVPLLHGNDAIGVINVESTSPRFFTEMQANFLQKLAEHAVISIDNARFLEERQYEIDVLTSLRTLALWLVSAGDTRSVAEAVLETAINILQGRAALLMGYDSNSNQLSILAHSPGMNDPAPQIMESARQAVKNTSARVLDQDEDTALVIPIRRSNRVYGVLYLIFPGQRNLLDRDMNTIELLASQAAGHLENAILHERIRAGRDQMRTILDSTRDGMILLDREVRLVESNAAAQNLLGIPVEDHIGEYFPDTLMQYVKELGETGYSSDEIQSMARILKLQPLKITRRYFQHKTKDKQVFIEEIGAPVMDDDNELVGRLLVLRDVTEEKELEAYREELTRLMVHDLRSPLVSIINGLTTVNRLVNTDMTALDVDDSRQLMQSLLTSANRLSRMVDSLLEIARLESREVKLELAPVPLRDMVDMAATTLNNSIERHHIDLVVQISDDLPLLRVDQEKVERVLINLLDNALRYTEENSKVMVMASVKRGTRQVQISVADSGPGIPPQERHRIFEKFRRVPGQQPRRGHRGTGLGLALVRAVIEAHGGSIRVADSGPLPGACFVFTLPAAE